MKKTVLAAAFACITSFAFAQDTTHVNGTEVMNIKSKNGTPILPEVNEWGLGFDATPFFDVIGGIFSDDTSNNSPSADFTRNHPLSIYGKLVKDDHTMHRVNAQINFGSTKTEYPVLQDSAQGIPYSDLRYVRDNIKHSEFGVQLGFGVEKRRGKGRVQGFYGPEIIFGYGSASDKATYANSFSQDNPNPSTNIEDSLAAPFYLTEINYGSTFKIGLRGFIGVEYFFMAKASIAAEFGWGLSVESTGEGKSTVQYWDTGANSGAGAIVVQNVPGPGKNSSMGFNTDNAHGALNLIFYF